MNGLQMLLLNNSGTTFSNVNIVDKCFTYRLQGSEITDSSLSSMISFANTILHKYADIKLPIVFQLGSAPFADKLIYVLFECLCDCLIEDYKYDVRVIFSQRGAIHTAGIRTSPLLILGSTLEETREKFPDAFASGLSTGRHFRRLLTRDEICGTDALCKMFDQIVHFQEMFDVNIDCSDAVAEVIVELVGNAGEHGQSDCLIDFDVAPHYTKRDSDGEYVGLNIAVVNFSSQLLGSSLKKKILSSQDLDERYRIVLDAFQNHQVFFNDSYDENDFFNITAFQHKISGRRDSVLVGGTGLTKLIESLERRADAHNCYMTSGNKRMWFRHQHLRYNDGWIGFNLQNDYVNSRPDASVLSRNKFYIPGTAYNLNFVMKVERKE